MNNPNLHNPNLAGEAFFWEGGPVGVLLVHGFTATTAEVRPLAQALHAAGYTVAGPLLPGHGTTPADLNQVRWQDWVETVEAGYQALKERCSPVFVGGESTGGLLALWLAAEHPQACAVLTYAPALKLTLRSVDRLRLYALAPFLPSVPKASLDAASLWQGYRVNPLKGTIQLLKLQGEIMPRLKRIHQPVLVVQGRLDLVVHPSVPDIILDSVSSQVKEKIWFERSAHTVAIDIEREEVAAVTLAFMERVLKTG